MLSTNIVQIMPPLLKLYNLHRVEVINFTKKNLKQGKRFV